MPSLLFCEGQWVQQLHPVFLAGVLACFRFQNVSRGAPTESAPTTGRMKCNSNLRSQLSGLTCDVMECWVAWDGCPRLYKPEQRTAMRWNFLNIDIIDLIYPHLWRTSLTPFVRTILLGCWHISSRNVGLHNVHRTQLDLIVQCYGLPDSRSTIFIQSSYIDCNAIIIFDRVMRHYYVRWYHIPWYCIWYTITSSIAWCDITYLIFDVS